MRLLIGAALVLVLGGCATLLDSDKNKVAVSSVPSGATVYLDGTPVATTPTLLDLPRGYEQQPAYLRVELDGYQPEVRAIMPRVQWLVILDCATIVGGLVDIAAGTHWRHDRTPVHVELRPR